MNSYDQEIRAWLRSPAALAKLAERGGTLPPLPDGKRLDLVPTMRDVVAEVDLASRMVALDLADTTTPVGWIVAATAIARARLGDARPIMIERKLAEALPDWPTRQSPLAALTEMRLPFRTVLLTLEREQGWLPLDVQLRTDGGDTIQARWAACLLHQPARGSLFAVPFCSLHSANPRELSSPAALLISDRTPPTIPAGVTVLTYRQGGELDVTSWAEPEHLDTAHKMLEVALLAVDRAAAAIELCNSANIVVVPRQLRGRAAKNAQRKQKLVPYVVEVRKGVLRPPRGSGGTSPAWSHRFDVRSHFAYYRRGPIYERHPRRRRYIPELGCEAVPVWRPPHIRGPADAPYRPKVWLLGQSAREGEP